VNKETSELKNFIDSLVSSQRKTTEEIKQRILNEVNAKISTIVDAKLAEFRLTLNNEINSSELEAFDPPQLNYEILPPEDTEDFDKKKSAIFMQIGNGILFEPEDLHVLGLKGKNLYWIKTEDCE
jgi:hypothetical protein